MRLSESSDDFELWRLELGRLRVGQAALLPMQEEAGGAPQCADLDGPLTEHVRHRQKYVHVPMPDVGARQG
jgi:hypothetical protein